MSFGTRTAREIIIPFIPDLADLIVRATVDPVAQGTISIETPVHVGLALQVFVERREILFCEPAKDPRQACRTQGDAARDAHAHRSFENSAVARLDAPRTLPPPAPRPLPFPLRPLDDAPTRPTVPALQQPPTHPPPPLFTTPP